MLLCCRMIPVLAAEVSYHAKGLETRQLRASCWWHLENAVRAFELELGLYELKQRTLSIMKQHFLSSCNLSLTEWSKVGNLTSSGSMTNRWQILRKNNRQFFTFTIKQGPFLLRMQEISEFNRYWASSTIKCKGGTSDWGSSWTINC